MSKEILERYIHLLEQLPKNKLKSTDENKLKSTDGVSRIVMSNIFETDDGLSEQEKKYKNQLNKSKKLKTEYLFNLNRENFYFLYNAFDLGKTYYTDKETLDFDIERLGNENKLVQSNLSHIKKTFRPQAVAIEQLIGKQDWLVIKSLKGYIEKFMWLD